MKKIFGVCLVSIVICLFLTACGSETKQANADYTVDEAENALNNGESINGQVVEVTVDQFVPNSTFGYNIQSGAHMNFVSNKNPNVAEGDTVMIHVKEVENVLGSYIITYDENQITQK
ncbi:hypothetical protein [Enterococcus sp. RIT-PI-f]|jgi:outer membrane lipoprotein-sorting protein|uniref:hypothetical protein n=1 Tax=Enterococcus sp. RIT-PI-f TaxID=1690244 RepID=UPI0006B93D54|nr:hypothetical protein [Enterococcus sp. RIT-PI-f]KPG71758.1 hypothetical protein AEQ18_03725 [Enterococcus sp. RIT-PI-f]